MNQREKQSRKRRALTFINASKASPSYNSEWLLHIHAAGAGRSVKGARMPAKCRLGRSLWLTETRVGAGFISRSRPMIQTRTPKSRSASPAQAVGNYGSPTRRIT